MTMNIDIVLHHFEHCLCHTNFMRLIKAAF